MSEKTKPHEERAGKVEPERKELPVSAILDDPIGALEIVCRGLRLKAEGPNGSRDSGMVAASRVATALLTLVVDGEVARLVATGDDVRRMHESARAYLRKRKVEIVGIDGARSSDPFPEEIEVSRVLIAIAKRYLDEIGFAKSRTIGLTEAQAEELASRLLDPRVIHLWSVFGPCRSRQLNVEPNEGLADEGCSLFSIGEAATAIRDASARSPFDGRAVLGAVLTSFWGGAKKALSLRVREETDEGSAILAHAEHTARTVKTRLNKA